MLELMPELDRAVLMPFLSTLFFLKTTGAWPEFMRCQHWAVNFTRSWKKWILMATSFFVESGELDPETGDVCRRALDHKYQALLDSLYI
ncbi:hypothetical protein PsorP6_018650 [Peronosclerospora sorghi]|nr:hypothetical protein PsorP6_018650 [Peronosclerospora sorghi]